MGADNRDPVKDEWVPRHSLGQPPMQSGEGLVFSAATKADGIGGHPNLDLVGFTTPNVLVPLVI